MSDDLSAETNHVQDESSSDVPLPSPEDMSDDSSSRRSNGECADDEASLTTDKNDESSEQFVPSPEQFVPSPEETSISSLSDDPSAKKDDESKSKKSSGSSENSLPSTEEISEGEFSTPEDKSPTADSPEDQKGNAVAAEDTTSKPQVEEQKLSISTDTVGLYPEYYDFADSDDSCSMNIEKYQAILESLKEMNKPKQVDVGKVVSRRRKRRRSVITSPNGEFSPSQFGISRQPKRQQCESSGNEALPPTPMPTSSESSQDTIVPEEPAGPVQISNDLLQISKSETIVPTPVDEVKPGEGESGQLKGSREKEDWKVREITETTSKYTGNKISDEDSEDTVDYELFGELDNNLAVSQEVVITDTPESPPPASTHQEASVQCKVALTTASSSFHGDSHVRRINSLTGLIDQIVAFSNYMEANPLLSVPGPAPRRLSAEELAPTPGPSSRPTLRELEEDFQRGFRALHGEVVDEEEATGAFRRSVREMRDHLRQAADGMARHSLPVETVPASEEPVTLEELREFLPKLWEMAHYNNILLKQWASTVLDWCLQPIPELYPQHFYDSEAGIRALYGHIENVRRSVARLMNRWRSRRMDYNELGDLTYLMTMASNAASLFNTLESEVTSIRYDLGTRHCSSRSERGRRQNSDMPKSKKDANRYKKGKKD